MSISPELLTKLEAYQPQIWGTVSSTASDATGQTLSFGSVTVLPAKTSDLHAEFSATMMVIQFALSSLPDSTMAVLIPSDAVEGLGRLICTEDFIDVDENVVADLRPMMEAIVQGICLASGQIKGDTIVASGIMIRYQNFTFPNNLSRAEYIARCTVMLTADQLNTGITWLMDDDAAAYLAGMSQAVEQEEPFQQMGSLGGAPRQAGAPGGQMMPGHTTGNESLDLLLDIPLEISVELGRVKMLVKEVVELGTGSIVEIDKAAGEPVDVMVNGLLVARGEVVVIEDNFGVRITEILNPQERLQRLNEAA